MMFATLPRRADDDEKKDIFAPVADLMVGVVFIFIILMLALALNLQNEDTVPRSEYEQNLARLHALEAENASLTARVEGLAQDNARLATFAQFVRDNNVTKLLSQLASADRTRTGLLDRIRDRLQAGGVDVTVNSALGTLMLPARRLFDVGRADPTPEGRRTIMQLGAAMAEVLPCYTTAAPQENHRCGSAGEASQLNAVYIEGHTDITPFTAGGGHFTDNWDLSAGRAIEAFKLVGAQYDTLRALRNQEGDALLGVSGYADTRPAVRDAPDRRLPDVAELDRRIEVRVIMTTNADLVGSILGALNTRLKALDDLIPR
ncbi:conserved protein of unknown function [Rhodovastum atsumiense]|uniref:OmpA family protein n=1 Tax=Rhodovastum atsumiense TaxID=504468 RepID=A0A5M6ISK4_9PROT|nr:hypothetical protein [Rhodovastum atsumiense]KAA5610869.1 hypothetical protein F1189_17495 [Rhodovastum atsumiense]CAH2602074.1 conserved protein of unknown function [Rhodovastum atsumiense]